jgi:hypothetical protein
MKYLRYSLLLLTSAIAQELSESNLLATSNMFFEDKLITTINVSLQNPPSTSFTTSVFRLSDKFRVKLYTTEFRYFNKTKFKSYEVQGNFILSTIYLGEKDLKIRELKIILEDGSEFDFEVDEGPNTQVIEASEKFYSTFSFIIPFEVLFEVLNSKIVEFRFRGAYTNERITFGGKPKSFFSVFYNTVKGYYFEFN